MSISERSWLDFKSKNFLAGGEPEIYMSRKEFTAVIIEAVRGGAMIEIPDNVQELYGKQLVKVKASFDNVEYQGSIVFMSDSDLS